MARTNPATGSVSGQWWLEGMRGGAQQWGCRAKVLMAPGRFLTHKSIIVSIKLLNTPFSVKRHDFEILQDPGIIFVSRRANDLFE
jgi:hypothetical protein